MPTLTSSSPSTYQKILFMGDSGTGKTGALASLAEAGYELFILDFDNGLAPLVAYCSDAAKGRIHYETLTDEVAMIGNVMKAKGTPKAVRKGLDLLDRWKDADGDFGDPAKWGPNRILVLDSLSFFGNAALRFVMDKNAQSVARQSDWGEAQNIISGVLAKLTAKTFETHVIVSTHVRYLENEENVVYKGWPSALGKALGPEVPKYFNIMLGADRRGTPKILTRPAGVIEYKFPHPNVKGDYPLATGMREIFKLLRGTEPGTPSAMPSLPKT